jgi:hypothetical protein
MVFMGGTLRLPGREGFSILIDSVTPHATPGQS